jgi:hypothetical protein
LIYGNISCIIILAFIYRPGRMGDRKLFSDIYLDNNATTRVRDSVKRRLGELLDEPLGNPSSPHSWGQRSREAVEAARIVATTSGRLSATMGAYAFA